jgi:hypothetical protein
MFALVVQVARIRSVAQLVDVAVLGNVELLDWLHSILIRFQIASPVKDAPRELLALFRRHLGNRIEKVLDPLNCYRVLFEEFGLSFPVAFFFVFRDFFFFISAP